MTGLRVCFVVNAVGQGSIPADIATAVTRHTEHTVDLLAWFDADAFEGDDVVAVTELDAPDTALGIDRATHATARDHLREYDLVQANHNHAGSFAKVIAREVGVPTVSREGNTRDGFTRKGRVANGLTNGLASRVVCISRSVYDSFRWWERRLVDDADVEIVPNGVDLEKIRTAAKQGGVVPAQIANSDALVVGNAGMLYEQKAQDVLIEAAARLDTRLDRPVHVVVAGDGPERESLASLAADLDFEEHVHLLGYLARSDVYAMLADVDVYAMPSRWEGFCVAVAEALALGVPSVVSDIDTFTELYDGGVAFHPVDDVEALCDRLYELATDDAKRNALASRGRELAEERYAIESVARRYADIYETVVAEST